MNKIYYLIIIEVYFTILLGLAIAYDPVRALIQLVPGLIIVGIWHVNTRKPRQEFDKELNKIRNQLDSISQKGVVK